MVLLQSQFSVQRLHISNLSSNAQEGQKLVELAVQLNLKMVRFFTSMTILARVG